MTDAIREVPEKDVLDDAGVRVACALMYAVGLWVGSRSSVGPMEWWVALILGVIVLSGFYGGDMFCRGLRRLVRR